MRIPNEAALVVLLVILAVIPVGGVAATDAETAGPEETHIANTFRKEVGQLQLALRVEHASEFGGLWVEGDGTVVIAIVGAGLGVRSLASAALPIEPRYVTVARSEAELLQAHDAVAESAGEGLFIDGIQISSITTDIVSNQVIVAVVDATADQLLRLRAQFNDGVAVTSVLEPVSAHACTVSNCPSPLKAGLKLYRAGAFACMSGFVFWTVVPKYYLSTAGHCTNSAGGWYDTGQSWQHPAGVARGTVRYGGWYNGSSADVALIEIVASQKGNVLCYGTSTCGLRSITAAEVAGSDYVGEWVCGQTQAGVTCDNILHTDVTANVCIPGTTNCRTIYDLRRVDFTTQGGDSGGPIYYLNEAIGVISSGASGDTFYSHVDLLHYQAAVLVRTSP